MLSVKDAIQGLIEVREEIRRWTGVPKQDRTMSITRLTKAIRVLEALQKERNDAD